MTELTNLTKINYDKESIINRLISNLEFNNIDHVKLFQFLRENKLYLVDDFLLNSIYSDVYIESKYKINIITFADKYDRYNENNLISIVKKLQNFTRENEIEKIGFSLETVYKSDIKTYINRAILDICSNYYDGEELYIKNLNSIINRCANIIIEPLDGTPDYNISDVILTYIDVDPPCNFDVKIILPNNNTYDLLNTNKNIQNTKVILFLYKIEDYELINKLNHDIETIIVYYKNKDENKDKHDFNNININLSHQLKEIRFCNMGEYLGKPKIPYGCDLYIDNKRIL